MYLNTSLHLADVRANYPSKHNCIEHSAIMENGKRVWKAYETLFVDGEDFEQIGSAFEKSCKVTKVSLGNGTLTFMKQRELVDFAIKWIEANRKEKIPKKKLELKKHSIQAFSLLNPKRQLL